MSMHSRVADIVSPERLASIEAEWSKFAELAPADTERLQQYLHNKLHGLAAMAAVLDTPDDAEELARSLAAFWLELRFEWERYNSVSNYQLVRSGAADAAVLASGSACSAVLALIEEAVSASEIERLQAIALSLIDDVRPDFVTGSVTSRAA